MQKASTPWLANNNANNDNIGGKHICINNILSVIKDFVNTKFFKHQIPNYKFQTNSKLQTQA